MRRNSWYTLIQGTSLLRKLYVFMYCVRIVLSLILSREFENKKKMSKKPKKAALPSNGQQTPEQKGQRVD